MNHGFIKVAAAVPRLKVADCAYNGEEIISLMKQADEQKADLMVFPELSLSACTCGDLFLHTTLLKSVMLSLNDILEASLDLKVLTVVGMPLAIGHRLHKVAVALQEGRILGIVPDCEPNDEEQRWFSADCTFSEITLMNNEVPCSPRLLLQMDEALVGIIFEHESNGILARTLALDGANILVNMSGQCDYQGHYQSIRRKWQAEALNLKTAVVYSAAGMGESSGDHVYGGHSFILEEDRLLAEGKAFQTNNQLIVSDINLQALYTERLRSRLFKQSAGNNALTESPIAKAESLMVEAQAFERCLDLHRNLRALPFVPTDDESLEEIFNIQVCGLAKRMQHIGMPALVLGISGGLDSTLSLLVAVKACDKLGISREKVLGITMPGFGTSDRTYHNALNLMETLGISTREINIKAACEQHFSDIGHNASQHNVVYENAQARERTQILMDIANQVNGIVVGTGDLSELALGWATYNGDHMSMYATNASLPKTLIRHLVSWIAGQMEEDAGRILLDIVDTPVSPELLPTDTNGSIAQKTEDLVGPYELHDFFLYHIYRHATEPGQLLFMAQQAFKGCYEEDVILHWLKTFIRRFFTQQFKRACMPEGAQATEISLSPRGAWTMPSDVIYTAWLENLENA